MTRYDITRWRRYGHDRLYVEADGTRLGYWDLAAGSVHPAMPEFEEVITHVAAGWRASNLLPAPEVSTQPIAGEPAVEEQADAAHVATLSTSVDLAANQPGAAARSQAQALRAEAPLRTLLSRALGLKTDERAWRLGAAGEEAVAAQLRKLGKRWHVLHAVPVGTKGSDIDHVVIGPAGVFTLNAKNHPDATIWVHGNTFKVNGHNVPYVRNSRYEAVRAASLLSAACGLPVPVTGAIVIYGATGGFTIKRQPEDVHIVARRQVTPWLRKLPAVLTDEQVAHVYDHARRSTTWVPRHP